MDRSPNATALREARRLQELGDSPSVCAFCTYEGPVIVVTEKWLKAFGVPKKLLEDHHVSGKKHDSELTIPLCHNCHDECHEGILREGVRLQPAKDERERIALSLEAEAAFFERYAEAQRRKANRVRGLR